MSTEFVVFFYTLTATIGMGAAWLISGGPWTQGDAVIGVALVLLEFIAGWNRRSRPGATRD